CGELTLHGFKASDVSGQLTLDSGRVQLSNVQATFLGGRHRGDWTADFTGSNPRFSGRGTLDHASMHQRAAAMGDSWATGALSGKYQAQFSGATTQEMLAAAVVHSDFTWRDGTLTHVALTPSANALHFSSFQGHLAVSSGRFALERGSIATTAGIYQVS